MTSSEKVQYIEQLLATEVRVTSALYDMDPDAHEKWAMRHIAPTEFARFHTGSWRQGRRRAAVAIATLMLELRQLTKDSDEAWDERLHRLGITHRHLLQMRERLRP
jgi:hypothetical protein